MTRRRNAFFFILPAILVLMLLTAGISEAITLNVAPNPATTGQTVFATVTASYLIGGPLPCGVQIRFSATDPFVNIGNCTTPCNIPRVYSGNGSYTVTVQGAPPPPLAGCTPPSAPSPVSANVTVNCPALTITTPGTLPSATSGQAYTQQLLTSGGQLPITFSIVSGSLPAGLNMSSTGLITGTPSSSGTSNFTVRATDSCSSPLGGGAQTVDRAFSITINPAACPALSITSPSTLSPGTVGSAYSYQVTTSGGQAPVTFSVIEGSLPSGLNMNSAGFISGMPTAAGSFGFMVRAADSCGAGAQTADRAFALTINPQPCPPLSITSAATLPNGIVNQGYSYQLNTSGGQAPITFNVVSGSLPSGLNLNSSGLIAGTPTTTGTFNFAVQAADSCAGGAQTANRNFSITINPQPCSPLNITSPPALSTGTISQTYLYQLSTSGGQAPVTFNLIAGLLPSGLNMNSAGLISGMPTATGTFNFTVRATDSCGAGTQTVDRAFSLTINPASCPALSITSPPAVTNGMVNQSYTYQVTTSGGQAPVTFNVVAGSLPSGMNMSSAGLISGMPTAAGTSNFTVRATDSCPGVAQTTQQAFTLTINPQPCPPLSITSAATLPNGIVNQGYSYQLNTSGGQAPITFNIVSGSLPSGLNMNSAGFISGMPTAAGAFNFTVQATDSCAGGAQTVQQAFALTINPQPCAPLSITSPPALPNGIVNQGYSYQLNAWGGQPSITFSAVSGSLPPGLTLNASGLITGTPTTNGTFYFLAQATDSCPGGAQTAQRTFSLTIGTQPAEPCAPLKITSLSLLTTGMVSQAYSYQTQTSGGQSPILFSLASGTLPPGLSLSPAGRISGTPNTSGNYSFAVMATDSCPAGAQNAMQSCSLYVQPYQGTLSVITAPSSFSIPRGESSALGVNYQFSGTAIANANLSSPGGVFMVGDTVIEVRTTFLTVNVRNGSGSGSENISVPVRVLEEAMKRGSTGFIYRRTFSSPDGGITLNTTVNFTITTEAGAAFQIRRIDLYFENRRPEITIPRYCSNLRAYADIRFVGSGLLQGFWEVDGRILSRVDRHLLYGSSVTIETPEIPLFPTFDPGYHIVKFIITNPAVGIPLKEILYFVTTDEAPGKPAKLSLYTPENGGDREFGPSTFTWEKPEKTAFFTIQFFEDPKTGPVFSAFTKEASYTLPESILLNSFSPGRKYFWKVTGFNSEGNAIAESEPWSFTLTAAEEYVKGQILIVFAESELSEGLIREMQEKYVLTFLEEYSLRALDRRMVLFSTPEQDIAGLAEKMRKNKNIFLVQPNYIFRTMGDPLCKNQYANTMLNIDKLRPLSTGKGVKVAVIDTGVDADHDDLKARVSFKQNFVRGESYAPEIHGTAVAGVIAASINGSGIEGVAPEASLIALRACRQGSAENPAGECRTDSLARALDEAIDQRVHIVNMSFGTPHYDNLLARLIDRGNEEGILFVAPASNEKNDRRLRFPASHPAVISVGGLDEQMNPYPNSGIAKASSTCAPALNILTTFPGNKHNVINGTSLSSAYISGILALAVEKDKSVSKKTLPAYKGNICTWEEELLKIKICEK